MNRTNSYLESRLRHIWKKHFPDILHANTVIIKFGRRTRNQLGSLKAIGPRKIFRRPGRFPKPPWWLPESTSVITINGHFKNPDIPEQIIDITIAHELVHYAHGFSSPHPQLYRYPHQGSVVNKELIARGLADALKFQKHWLKTIWRKKIEKSQN